MKVLELFSGTGVVSDAFARRGHEIFRVDYDKQFPAELHCDVLSLTAKDVLDRFGRPDVIWASPDCSTYSVAAISHHRKRTQGGYLAPRTDQARYSDLVNLHLHNLIMELSPRVWFIENPRGGMRSMEFMHGLTRYTVTYCHYGEKRMKPTDIWTNHPNPRFKKPCKNGDPCHESAPRGSRKGTQALNSVERAVIPRELCEHIADICEEYIEAPRCFICGTGLSIRDDCDLEDLTGEAGRFFLAECESCGTVFEIKAKEREDE